MEKVADPCSPLTVKPACRPAARRGGYRRNHREELEKSPDVGPRGQMSGRRSRGGGRATEDKSTADRSQSSTASSFGAIGRVGLGTVVDRRRLAGPIGPKHRLAVGGIGSGIVSEQSPSSHSSHLTRLSRITKFWLKLQSSQWSPAPPPAPQNCPQRISRRSHRRTHTPCIGLNAIPNLVRPHS